MSKITTVEIIDSSQSSVDDKDSGPSERLDGKQREAVNRPGARTAQTRGTREERAQQRDFFKCVTDMSEDEQVVLAMKMSCEEKEKPQTQEISRDLETPEVSSIDGSPPCILGSVSPRSTIGRAQMYTTRQHKSPTSDTVTATDIGGSYDSKLNTDASQPSSDLHGADDEDSIKSDCVRKPHTHISLKRKHTQSSSVINKKAKVLSTLGEEHPIEFTTQNKDGDDDVDFDAEPCKRSINNCPIVLNANDLQHDIGTEENGPSQMEYNNPLISGGAKTTEGVLPCSSIGKTLSRDDVVNYYWGVPFCPAGLNPDEYTSVILCQLQTYAAVVKQQQRRLLRKANMCEVLPEPAKDRRWRGRSEARADDAKGQPFATGEESGVAGEEKQGVGVQGGQSTSRERWEEKEESNNVNEDEGLSEDEEENEDSESSVEKVCEKNTNYLRASTMSPPDEKENPLPKCKLQRRKGLHLHKDVTYSDTPKLGEMEYGKICDDDDDDFISLPTLKRVSGTPQQRADEVVFFEDNCTASERRRTPRRDSSAFSTGSPYLSRNTRSDNCSKNEMMLSRGSVHPRNLTLASFSAMDGKIPTPTRVRKESDGKIMEQIGEKVNVTHRTKNSKVMSSKFNQYEFDLILDDDNNDDDDDDKQTNTYYCTRKMAISECKEYKNQSGDSKNVVKVRDIERKLTTSPLANDGTIVTNKAKLKVTECEEEEVMERYEEISELSLQSSDERERKQVLSLQKHKLKRKNEKKERLERTVPCPLCLVEFLACDIEQHASECCISEDVDDAENYVPSNSKMEVPSCSREGSTRASHKTLIPESDSNSSTSLLSEREGAGGSEDILEGIVISNSPIKSFRSISQSPDCLIDFKNQFNKPGRPRTGFKKQKTRRSR
ncbi:unnamed protein product [Lampetra planeri]